MRYQYRTCKKARSILLVQSYLAIPDSAEPDTALGLTKPQTALDST